MSLDATTHDRTILKTMTIGILARVLALWLGGFVTAAHSVPVSTNQRTPNVVVFFVDDLGYGDLGFTGHPTTKTPNIDELAKNGKILSSFYSGYPVCTASRAALMTGRQPPRIGVPGVFGPTVNVGLPLNETTLAQQFKRKGYKTAIMGKWHLGQREMFLPGSRGFDSWLGIPYSDDMGGGRATPCSENRHSSDHAADLRHHKGWYTEYCTQGWCHHSDQTGNDPAATYLPLVLQTHGDGADATLNTTVLEQPLDFSTIGQKYNAFATNFISANKDDPFFLYMPFSHVHTTNELQPEMQYCGCEFKNKTSRGAFGDALAEIDWMVGNVVEKIRLYGLEENTLILFTGDNGPWMIRGSSAGSTGLFYGRSSGYWNVGKGSTWEGGVHEAAFAYWKGKIKPRSRSDETISAMDIFPTLSSLINADLPQNVVIDGRDMGDILFDRNGGKSHHQFLFFYGLHGCQGWKGPAAVRYGTYKAHFSTTPGLGGCENCKQKCYCEDPDHLDTCKPLLFNILEDPSEAYPLDDPSVVSEIVAGLRRELLTFRYGKLVAPADRPGEGPGKYGVCCDRSKNCDCSGPLPPFHPEEAGS